jgi:hypothetical protein
VRDLRPHGKTAPHRTLSATTNDHYGPVLAPNSALQYQAETSGHAEPRSSRIISHTAMASPP